ncbi:MAG: hypothetical protein IK031_00255 [Bacteroidales bacterium]|nr:hypothetical protein [Bacteroidales bacterium]
MKLIKIAAVLAGILACCSAFAQSGEAVQAPEGEAYKVYCEISCWSSGLTDKKTVEVDFGQYSNWFSGNKKLADENGKAIPFNSMIEAANYMARRGWTLEQAFVENRQSNGSSISPILHYLMSKMITSDEQISEGIITVDMAKKK